MDQMTSFTPSPDHAGAYRAALGQFATGVALITTHTPRGPLAMTANSFTSVSLDPPLILWCPARVSARHDAFVSADHFAVHVLAEDQLELARHFARQGEAFDGLDCKLVTGAHDTPLIEPCLARFECRRHTIVSAGDHTIIIGKVTRVSTQSGAPLGFQNGKFGSFTPAL